MKENCDTIRDISLFEKYLVDLNVDPQEAWRLMRNVRPFDYNPLDIATTLRYEMQVSYTPFDLTLLPFFQGASFYDGASLYFDWILMRKGIPKGVSAGYFISPSIRINSGSDLDLNCANRVLAGVNTISFFIQSDSKSDLQSLRKMIETKMPGKPSFSIYKTPTPKKKVEHSLVRRGGMLFESGLNGLLGALDKSFKKKAVPLKMNPPSNLRTRITIKGLGGFDYSSLWHAREVVLKMLRSPTLLKKHKNVLHDIVTNRWKDYDWETFWNKKRTSLKLNKKKVKTFKSSMK